MWSKNGIALTLGRAVQDVFFSEFSCSGIFLKLLCKSFRRILARDLFPLSISTCGNLVHNLLLNWSFI
ncbi:hypothetical protein [Clostridium thermosuccinogenes]|uniref:hypothetical protein n=1 Tax=Clostridium thermosuccinogenes TaxID=84032 RepID=UPI00125EBD23|nr:hypothetical protein [Pseudoclostridium thermosuccinogenes]